MATQNAEDYLRTIYKLQEEHGTVATKRIAEELGITMPSVTDMVQKLSRSGLVAYRRYRGVRLTDEGMREALRVTRRHRLWEMFLARTLSFRWDEVHEYADLLEHVMPAALEERIDKFLGRPARDPHGEPIPAIDGTVPSARGVPLTSVEPGVAVRVERVRDAGPGPLRLLAKAHIVPGGAFKVINTTPFDGSMRVRVGTKTYFLTRELATLVFVTPLRGA
jgi:DtxR family Mn-dependent transcriptional regulator